MWLENTIYVMFTNAKLLDKIDHAQSRHLIGN